MRSEAERAAAPFHRSARGAGTSARRASGRSPGGRPPFSAGGRAVRLDVRAVDCCRAVDAAVTGQRLENLKPQPLPAPAIEAVVDRRVRAIGSRTIAPPRARAQHVHDPADNAPIINPMRTASTARQQRLDPSPLRIAQPRNPLHRKLPVVWKLESHLAPEGNP